MAQFLSDAFMGTQVELAQLKRNKDFDEKLAVALLAQFSILGVLKDLPIILSTLREQMKERETQITEIKKRAKDPLAEETEDGL